MKRPRVARAFDPKTLKFEFSETLVLQITAVAMAVLIGVMEILSVRSDAGTFWDNELLHIVFTLTICITFSFVAFLGIFGELLFIGVYASFALMPEGPPLQLMMLGLGFIACRWIVARKTTWAILLLGSVVLINAIQTEITLNHIVAYAFLIASTLLFGFGLRLTYEHVTTRNAELEQARLEVVQAESSIKKELARNLHDTVARDLARIAMTLESVGISHPDLRDQLDPIMKLARESSRRLKPTIAALNVDLEPSTFSAAVRESELVLGTRGISLTTMLPPELDQLFDQATSDIACLVLREATYNILKHAKRNSEAHLIVEAEDGNTSLTILNKRSAANSSAGITEGFGLINLHRQVEECGGKLTVSSSKTKWGLHTAFTRQAVDA